MNNIINNSAFRVVISIIVIFSIVVALVLKGIEYEKINEAVYGLKNYDEKTYRNEYKEIDEDKRVLIPFSKYKKLEDCNYILKIGSFTSYLDYESNNSLFFKLICNDNTEFQVLKKFKEEEQKNIYKTIEMYYFYKYDKQIIKIKTLNDYSKKELEDMFKREHIKDILNGINQKLKEHNKLKEKLESNIDSWE